MTPNREQILNCIRANPGISTVELVSKFEDPSNPVVFKRAYECVWKKLKFLAKRGDVERTCSGAPKDGQRWIVPRRAS